MVRKVRRPMMQSGKGLGAEGSDGIDREMIEKSFSKAIARAWIDPKFKQLLFADAAAALKEIGVVVPTACVVKAIEETDEQKAAKETGKVVFLVVPPLPSADEISEYSISDISPPCEASGPTVNCNCGCNPFGASSQ